jgi:transposase
VRIVDVDHRYARALDAHIDMDALVDVAVAAACAVDAAALAAAPARIVDVVTRYHRTTVKERYAIVALHEDGQSMAMIHRKLGISVNTVRRWIDTYERTRDVKDERRSGRPRCTDDDTDHTIALVARDVKFTSPRQIKRTLGLDASCDTIDRRLRRAGLYGRVARHKRDYTNAEVRKRLSFANGYGHHDKQWWEHVLFSDEKCFYGRGFCGRAWVRRPIGAALDPTYCVNKLAHPVKVNMWACFCAAGQGYCHIFNETMDAKLMRDILSDNLIPSANLHFSTDPPQPWFLLHDNDKKFTSHLVTDFLHNSGVTSIEFPPYSPDLNPLENLWASMARACEKRQCDTMEQLQEVVDEEWNNVSADLMHKLAHSMPARCQAVVKANGWHTKY